jgi:hypothetical protein
VPPAEARLRQRLAAQRVRAFERRLLEIAGRKGAQAIEHGEVRDGAEAAVLVGYRPEAAPPQRIGDDLELVGASHRRVSRAAHSNGLQVLRAHDGADAAAPRVAPAVADRRKPDPILTRHANRRRKQPGTIQLLANRRFGLVWRLAPQMFGGPDLNVVAVDEYIHG